MSITNQQNTQGYPFSEQVVQERVMRRHNDVIPRGTLLGQRTADREFARFNPAANDGTEIAVAIAFDDIPAASGDVATDIMVAGRVDENLIPDFPASTNFTNVQESLRRVSIYLTRTTKRDRFVPAN